MRAILTIFMLTLVTGCANYSQPLYPYEEGQGVYYEDGLPAWSGAPITQFDSIGSYPFWSMDYFYLGHHPYRPWGFSYYSPNFHPYYFSVLYPPWHWQSWYGYGGNYAWRDPYWDYCYRRYQRSPYGGLPGGDVVYGPTPLASGARGGNPGVGEIPLRPFNYGNSEYGNHEDKGVVRGPVVLPTTGMSGKAFKSTPRKSTGLSRNSSLTKKTSPVFSAPPGQKARVPSAPISRSPSTIPGSRAPVEYVNPDRDRH